MSLVDGPSAEVEYGRVDTPSMPERPPFYFSTVKYGQLSVGMSFTSDRHNAIAEACRVLQDGYLHCRTWKQHAAPSPDLIVYVRRPTTMFVDLPYWQLAFKAMDGHAKLFYKVPPFRLEAGRVDYNAYRLWDSNDHQYNARGYIVVNEAADCYLYTPDEDDIFVHPQRDGVSQMVHSPVLAESDRALLSTEYEDFGPTAYRVTL